MQGTKGTLRLQSTSVLKRSVRFCNGKQNQASLFYSALTTQPLNTIPTAFLMSELLLKMCSRAASIPKRLLLPRIEGCRRDKVENYFEMRFWTSRRNFIILFRDTKHHPEGWNRNAPLRIFNWFAMGKKINPHFRTRCDLMAHKSRAR